jgi:OTU-like cysteine protease
MLSKQNKPNKHKISVNICAMKEYEIMELKAQAEMIELATSNDIDDEPSEDQSVYTVSEVDSITDDEKEPLNDKVKEPGVISNNTCLMSYINQNFDIRNVRADGNCFYRAILVALGGNQDHNENLRNLVCEYLQENYRKVNDAFSQEDSKKFVEEHRRFGEWADDIIIYSTALLLGMVIQVFVPGYAKPLIFNENNVQNRLYIINSNNNHFQALIPKTQNNQKSQNTLKSQKIENPVFNIEEVNNKKQDLPTTLPKLSKIPERNFCYPKDGRPNYDDIAEYVTNSSNLPERLLSNERKIVNSK